MVEIIQFGGIFTAHEVDGTAWLFMAGCVFGQIVDDLVDGRPTIGWFGVLAHLLQGDGIDDTDAGLPASRHQQ